MKSIMTVKTTVKMLLAPTFNRWHSHSQAFGVIDKHRCDHCSAMRL